MRLNIKTKSVSVKIHREKCDLSKLGLDFARYYAPHAFAADPEYRAALDEIPGVNAFGGHHVSHFFGVKL
jgi:hypothetical protein